MTARALTLLVCLALAAPLALLAALAYGSVEMSWAEVLHALRAPHAAAHGVIVWELRLPRVLSAFACGALLALAGVLLQALVRNPLAEPYVLGISGGAALAAVAALFLGAGLTGVRVAALVGALVTVWLVFALSYRRHWDLYRLLLTGVVLAAGCGAGVSLLLVLAPPLSARGMLYWLMGDLSAAQTPAWPGAALLVVAAFALAHARALNALAAGALQALAVGVAVDRLQVGIYFVASLATAAVVSEAGTIGFIGLVVPHAVRLLGLTDHRALLPAATLLGGISLVLADLAARTLAAPPQLPVGAITALIGVPVLLWLLGRRP